MEQENYLLLSQITHAGYCLRRAALVMNEQLWAESSDTAKGRVEHERVHDKRIERRGNQVKLYEYDVVSHSLGVLGKCDCIEASKNHENGCQIPAVEFPVTLYPVEFKHGRVRSEEEYELQLCAQAMCLEEMYQTHIAEGALFYTSSHRRYPVMFTEELRAKTIETIEVLRKLQENLSTPRAEYSKKCLKCSLKSQCQPKLPRSAAEYCEKLKKRAKEAEPL